MKILFPFVGDSVGGSHISSLELYLLLIDANIAAVIVLHEDNTQLSQYLQYRNIPFSVIKTSTLAGPSPNKLSIIIGMLTNFFRFGLFIKKNKIDIVHGNDLRVNLSWSLPAMVFSEGFVWHQRTLLSSSKFWLLIRYLCNNFVAISGVVMQSAPKNIPCHKKGVVHNPFNISSLLDKNIARNYVFEKYRIPNNCFLLGCVGRVVDYKNIDFVIKNIYNIYQKLNKNIYLVVVGAGTEEYVNKLKTYSRDLGIDNHVIFTGFLNNTDKIIASLDLLVAPSITDAFGRTIVEAMLQNTPVLAAKSGGHVNIIDDGVNGTFYSHTIKGDFFDKVSTIMDNPGTSTSDNAYQFAQTNFSPERHLNNILSIYRSLLIS